LINLLLSSILSSLILITLGLSINKVRKLEDLCLEGICAAIYISFVALLLNFFFPLSKNLNTALLILIIIYAAYKKINNYKNLIILSTLSGFISFLILNLDNIYRPDAGLYHIPYIATLNENKIIFGLANIHFRYGHTSIGQYLSAFYNNYIFDDKGITLPIASIFSLFFLYLIIEIKNNLKTNIIYTIFLLLTFIYLILGYSRYTEFGNDVTAHLYLFLVYYIFLKNFKKKKSNILLINKIFLLSIFAFMQKISMIFTIFIPIYCFYFLKDKIKIINFSNIFSTIFVFLFLIKNILISGCLIYPISITCSDKLQWYGSDIENSINAKVQSLDNEAWTKGWPDLKGKNIGQENYIKNFNWLETWSKNHGLKILNKLGIFLLFILFFFYLIKLKENTIKKNKNANLKEIKENITILLFVSFVGTSVWFLRFPVFRYGSSYLVSLIILLSILIFINTKYETNIKIFKRTVNYFIIILIALFIIKNLIRIFSKYNLEYYNYPWPKIYSERNDNGKLISQPIYINNQLAYYFASEECHYSSSPCTHIKNNNLTYYEKYNYKFFFIIK
jgi:hypothetical protein